MTDIRAAEDCASGSSAMAVVRAGSGGRATAAAILTPLAGNLCWRAREIFGGEFLVRKFWSIETEIGKYDTSLNFNEIKFLS